MTTTREDVQLVRDAANVFNPDLDDIHNRLEDLADRMEVTLPSSQSPPDAHLEKLMTTENRLLPTKPFAGMLVEDLLVIEWPHLAADDRWFWLWEATGYPSFFAGDGWPVHTLQQQMRDFREGRYEPL